MPVEVIMPKVDMDMTSGTFAVWHVEEGEAEVDEPRLAIIVEHHVLGFKVAMDDLPGVSRGEAIAGAAEDVDDVDDHVRLRHPVAQRRAGQQFHHDQEAADLAGPKVLGVEIVDDDDVSVTQRSEHLGLCTDRRCEPVLGDARVELQRDLAAELAIDRLADDPARAVSERPQDLEPTVA